MLDRHRYRIWFCKTGVLRWISHRDLQRLWERLLRRCDIWLSMSEGFHPKPRLHFPSALALGVPGLREVVEVETARWYAPEDLWGKIAADGQPGLRILLVQAVPSGLAKAQLESVSYSVHLPAKQGAQVVPCLADDRWRQLPISGSSAGPLAGEGAAPDPTPDRTLDDDTPDGGGPTRGTPSSAARDGSLRDLGTLGDRVQQLTCDEGVLRMVLRAEGGRTVRPAQVLESLGLSPEALPAISATLCRDSVTVLPTVAGGASDSGLADRAADAGSPASRAAAERLLIDTDARDRASAEGPPRD
jgi:hypothetical protein